MAIIRVNHTDNYTVMSNYHLRDQALSLKAKGLLSQMLSLPPAWDFTVAGLVAINQEKESAITSALKELRERGYLTITKKLPNETESGRIEYIYDIYELPQSQPLEKQGTEKQGVENQGLEFQGVENPVQLNKDRLNKEKRITDNKRFIAPTLEEVQAYCQERGNTVDPERFIDYYSSNGWKVGKNPMKDWRAAVRTWEKNGYSQKQKETGYQTTMSADEKAFWDMIGQQT